MRVRYDYYFDAFDYATLRYYTRYALCVMRRLSAAAPRARRLCYHYRLMPPSLIIFCLAYVIESAAAADDAVISSF